MSWRRGRFKGKEIWIKVDAAGETAVHMGRVPIRYSKASGARVYRANINNVEVFADSALEHLGDGVGADEGRSPKSSRRGSGFGKAGTRTKSQAAEAAADAARRIAALQDGTTVVYTDGGCRGNPGPAGSGVYIKFADGRTAHASRSLGQGTNNIAELTAIDMALDLLKEAGVPPDAPVALFSDSTYANGVLVKGWKAKKNVELIQGIRAKLALRDGVTLRWIAGHVGVAGNEEADRLATAGVNGVSDVAFSDAPGQS